MVITIVDNQDDMEFTFSGNREELLKQIVQEYDLLSEEQLDVVINQGYIDREHVSACLLEE